ncbi:MAG TPA: hypothetical protein GXZ43_08640 [Clostridiaceae bacterium]|nr:hypothetical protein [Clostridiaceae bacterium]
MIKKAICICLTILMVLGVSIILSSCSKSIESFKNIISEINEKETRDGFEHDGKESDRLDDIKQNVKDVMNEVFDKSDADWSEKERDAINDFFDKFAD